METMESPPVVKNFVDGNFRDSEDSSRMEVVSPLDGQVISSVPLSSGADLHRAVEAARAAYPAWSGLTLKERVQVIFEYRALLQHNMQSLSRLIHLENGKTISEAQAEIDKAVELCEFAISLPQVISNEVQEVSVGVECRTERKPLGVVASVTPFNFPSMVPHWTIPNTLVLGNTMILKPSELVPLSAMRIAELLKETLKPGQAG